MTKPNSDPRIDAYIAKAPEFARPILAEARTRVHQACPAVEETIKWNAPFFLHQGKIIASMAAFKQHAKVGVWDGMSPTFVDVKSVDELPAAKTFAQSVKEAARRVEDGPAEKTASAKKIVAKKVVAKKALAAKKVVAEKAPAAKKAAAKKVVATRK